MTNEEIIKQFKDDEAARFDPEWIDTMNLGKALDLAREDERAKVIKEMQETMNKISGVNQYEGEDENYYGRY